MPLLQKYQQHDFQNGFQTHNSILDIVPYQPEVIFIGTYNHGWSWNDSDFFYGRGMYMWTVLANLFQFNCNFLVLPRNANNLQPTLQQIFEICERGKIVFANIVKGLKEDITATENIPERYVLINNKFKWGSTLINGRRVGEYADTHLEAIAKYGWLDDNNDAIINYINETPSIRHIYFTFKSGKWLVENLNIICKNVRQNVSFCSIFTPTAKGFGTLLNAPYNTRAWGLTHCWVWNGLDHSYPINKHNYGHLNHDWLKDSGVNPNNF